MRYDALGLVSEEDCQAQLEQDMANVAKEGGKCAAEAIKGGLIGGILGIVAGGVVTITTGGLIEGGGAAILVGGGAEFVDWCLYNHCMGKVNKMKDAAQKRYSDCMKKAEGQ